MKYVGEMLLSLEPRARAYFNQGQSPLAQHRPGEFHSFVCYVHMGRGTCRCFENACEVRGAHMHQHCKLLDQNSFGYVLVNEYFDASQHLTRQWRVRIGRCGTVPVAQGNMHLSLIHI